MVMNSAKALTLTLPGVPGRRGRPATGKALSAADRQRIRRERLAAEGKSALSVHVSVDVVERLDRYVADKCGDVTKDEVVQKALEAFFRRR
jgi:hypothetical protein